MKSDDISKARKRHQGCLRQQKHQAAKKEVRQMLEAELRYLEDQLEARRTSATTSSHRTGSSHRLLAVIFYQTQSLREQVQRQRNLLELLHAWVLSQEPQPGLVSRHAWVDCTLLADPTARHEGFEWLSRRVYHTALTNCPFGSFVGDAFRPGVAISNDGNDSDMAVTACGGHSQMTVFCDFNRVANAYWQHQRATTLGLPVVENVHDGLIYCQRSIPQMDLHMRTVLRLFHEPQRSVLTALTVSDDEKYPGHSTEWRVHGYKWTVFEHVAEGVTLIREANCLHFAPTCQGESSLPRIGHLFGVPPLSDTPVCYIYRLRAIVEGFDRERYHGVCLTLLQELEQTAADEARVHATN
ncbi:Aste57867_1465 [Aphanomyces stellatus]|uniref:Aste57867_1465 protein n=1 Tax=Aphanomyces stellatus TaxID=120398 RepID=A0A485K7X0_9STRA|nr:hypothetical protein As57867_001464 [Aphanomyces stellatus]VFT78681.1 Aste57867_1465 [Aphanomyces stellatus]